VALNVVKVDGAADRASDIDFPLRQYVSDNLGIAIPAKNRNTRSPGNTFVAQLRSLRDQKCRRIISDEHSSGDNRTPRTREGKMRLTSP